MTGDNEKTTPAGQIGVSYPIEQSGCGPCAPLGHWDISSEISKVKPLLASGMTYGKLWNERAKRRSEAAQGIRSQFAQRVLTECFGASG